MTNKENIGQYFERTHASHLSLSEQSTNLNVDGRFALKCKCSQIRLQLQLIMCGHNIFGQALTSLIRHCCCC